MSDEAKLIMRLEARTRKFEKDLSKAIDKLDGNVKRGNRQWDKGMTRMERRAKKMAKGVGDTLKNLTGVGAIGVGATLIGGVAATKAALNYAHEIENLSKLAGVSAERFQEMSFASDKFGISQEKIADILKDTNDKFGDFFATGGGPLVDFFEQVAPKIGLTADAFRGLSSDQALGLYVRSLEKAGANQQDLSFYMEALASDATLLLPLFKDNGSELDRLSKRGRELGTVLENDAIGKAADAKIAFDDLGESLRGNVRGAILEAAPEIQALSEDLIELAPQLVDWARAAIDDMGELADGIEDLADRWNAGIFGKGKAEVATTKSQIRTQIEELEDLHTAILIINRNPLKSFVGSAFDGEDNPFKTRDFLTQPRDVRNDIGKNIFGKEVYDAHKGDADAFIKLVLEKQQELQDALDTAEEKAEKKAEERKTKKTASGGGTGIKRDPTADAKGTSLNRQLAVIEELGRSEREQINDLLAVRLEAINKSTKAEAEKAALRTKAHEDAKREIGELEAEELEAARKIAEEHEAERRNEFDLRQDQLTYLAEIEAAQARMAGRAVEATQIELDAVAARYQAELDYIDAVIAKKGESAQLLADRANAQAGLATTQADQAGVNQGALDAFDSLGPQQEDALEAELERIEEQEAAKLERLEELRTEELEALRDFEAKKTAIEKEADDSRREARLASMQLQLSTTKDLLGGITSALKAAGKENTKAAKIAAKAQQVIALAETIVHTAQGVGAALATGNIPKAILVGALGAIQVGIIASQTFDGGGFTGRGARVGGVDGKGGFHAILHPNETVVDHTRPNAPIAGQTLEQGLGLQSGAPLPRGVNTRSIAGAGRSGGGDSFTSGDLIVQGNVDESALPALQEAMDQFINNQERNFNEMADARDKRTQPRTARRVGRGRAK